ncbi:WPP domain-containing protein 1 [Hibiscus syriacus]|uniref:WPP domain-containing protein 1 n=1 Tax=Hibiscus syriacus TaxID=106335 RepID=A0A6A2XXA7_HIBSY|nr:WPP domain-containing protein 2-like [Hibiscus syriacus]KAE8674730.1 WPP domain-containing protein 1 [Hibiscus syriacus]
MADPESPTANDSTAPTPTQVDDIAAKLSNLTFKIWPPTQRTRDAVLNRLVETLSSESVLSKRYGTIAMEEAYAVAKLIEEEAFSVAQESFSTDEDGIEILQVYSKEISKRMLDTVKARAATDSAPSGSAEADSNKVGTAVSEENSSFSVKDED